MLIIPCISLKQKDSPSRLSPMPLDSMNNKRKSINRLGRLGGPPQLSRSNNGIKKSRKLQEIRYKNLIDASERPLIEIVIRVDQGAIQTFRRISSWHCNLNIKGRRHTLFQGFPTPLISGIQLPPPPPPANAHDK